MKKSPIHTVSIAAILASQSIIFAQTAYEYTTDASTNWSMIQIGAPVAGDSVVLSANLLGNRAISMDTLDARVGTLVMRDLDVSNSWSLTGSNPLIFDNVGSTNAVLEVVNAAGINPMRIATTVQLEDSLVIRSLCSAPSLVNRGRFDFDGNIIGNGRAITFLGVSDFSYDQATTTISALGGFAWNASGTATFAANTSLVNGVSDFVLTQGVLGGAVNWNAPMTLGGDLTVDASGWAPVTISGQVTGAANLVILGGGLQPKFILFNNIEGNPGERNEVRLTNASANAFSGNTMVTGATLMLDYQTGNATKVGPGSLTLNGATLLLDDAGTGSTTQTFSGLTIGAGESNLVIKRDSVIVTLNLGSITRNTGGTAVFRYSNAPGATTFIHTTTASSNGILGGWAVLASTGTNADDIVGIGTGGLITAPGTNGAAAYTTLTASISGTGVENFSYTGGNLTRSVALTANSLRWANGNSTDATISTGSNPITVASGGILIANTGANGAVNSAITGTGLISGTDANADLYLYVRNNRVTVANPLIGAGTGALYKSGFGRLTVTADADYTGGTWLNGGVLEIGNASMRLSSGNLRISQGAQLGAHGSFTRSIGSGAGQVSFGIGGGGFSAEGGDLVVNLGGSGATLTSADFGGNLALNNAYSSTGVLTLVNPIDTTGGITISVGANVSPGYGRFQSSGGAAWVALQGGLTGAGDVQIFGSANPGNPNNPHSASGLLAVSSFGQTGNVLVNGATLYVPPSALANMRPLAITGGGQLASSGTRTFALGAGVGEMQFLGSTFIIDGGFAAVGADFTVTLNDGDTSIQPGANFAPSDIPLGCAHSGYTTTFTNNITAGMTFLPSGPGLTVFSGAMSGAGGITVGGNNPTAGVLLVTGSNTFTGNASSGNAGGIYRAGSADALGASGGDNATVGGTFDLNGFSFPSENFNAGGNSSGTFEMGRIINSNVFSAATMGNLRLMDLFGGGAYLGGDGTLNVGNITTSAMLAQGGSLGWRGTGTLILRGSNTGTYGGTNQLYRTFLQGGTVNLNYTTAPGAKLLSLISGTPGANSTLSLANVNVLLTGNASAPVVETVADSGTIGGTALDGGSSSLRIVTAVQNVTMHLNRIAINARSAISFSTDATLGGTATFTTDALNNTAGILGAWVTWGKNH